MNRTGISEKVFEISGGILKRMPVWAENSPKKEGNPQEDTCMGQKTAPGKGGNEYVLNRGNQSSGSRGGRGR